MSATEEVYATHLYAPEAIPELKRAWALMEQAYAALLELWEKDAISEGSPAAESMDSLENAIAYFEPEDEEPEPPRIRLAVDNTRQEVQP